MNERSNQQLKSALAAGELSPRKQAVAKEVLRRRYDKEGKKLWAYVWLPLIAVLGIAQTVLRRFHGRHQIQS